MQAAAATPRTIFSVTRTTPRFHCAFEVVVANFGVGVRPTRGLTASEIRAALLVSRGVLRRLGFGFAGLIEQRESDR